MNGEFSKVNKSKTAVNSDVKRLLADLEYGSIGYEERGNIHHGFCFW